MSMKRCLYHVNSPFYSPETLSLSVICLLFFFGGDINCFCYFFLAVISYLFNPAFSNGLVFMICNEYFSPFEPFDTQNSAFNKCDFSKFMICNLQMALKMYNVHICML